MVDKITTPPSQKDVIDKVNELVDGKQDTLVSGTNLKTINNMSLLGSGNISISTGGTYTAGDGIDITNGVISVDSTVALKTDVPTITDIYSASSSDGMSGKAVASAISGKADSSSLSDYIAKSGGSAQQTISLTSGTGTTPLGIKSMSNSSYISFSGSSGWLASFGINSSKKPVIYDGSSHTIAYTTDIPTKVSELTNDSGYTTNTGTVTSVNSVSPVNGNVTLSIPTTTSSVTSGSTAALTSGGAYTALQSYQTTANLVTSVSSSSTNSQYPSAKCVYDLVGDIETALNTINSGGASTITVSIYVVETYGSTYVTIGDQTFNNVVAGTTYTYEATVGESYNLIVSSSSITTKYIKDSNGNQLSYGGTSGGAFYTFTASEDVTYRVGVLDALP